MIQFVIYLVILVSMFAAAIAAAKYFRKGSSSERSLTDTERGDLEEISSSNDQSTVKRTSNQVEKGSKLAKEQQEATEPGVTDQKARPKPIYIKVTPSGPSVPLDNLDDDSCTSSSNSDSDNESTSDATTASTSWGPVPLNSAGEKRCYLEDSDTGDSNDISLSKAAVLAN
ncbi:hypothetical protein HDE_04023 [Halotydeus destructor]|nr:hypothetical protein HDE_04023 [Halotydeus destructor]